MVLTAMQRYQLALLERKSTQITNCPFISNNTPKIKHEPNRSNMPRISLSKRKGNKKNKPQNDTYSATNCCILSVYDLDLSRINHHNTILRPQNRFKLKTYQNISKQANKAK